MMPEHLQKLDPLDQPIHITVWLDKNAREKKGGVTTLRAFAEKIRNNKARSKSGLKLLKLAHFGDVKTDNDCLRHNLNVELISGVEADYDAGLVSFDEAVECALKANIASVVYTSPSHTPETPKWRVVAPFSEEMEPGDRDHMMGRLNGAFHGVLAPESWVLSQSYYYGCVDGKENTHRVELIDGEFIDDLDELDQTIIGKPNRAPKHKDSGPPDYGMFANLQPLDVESAKEGIRTGICFHNNIVSLAAHYMAGGYNAQDTFDMLVEIMEEVPLELRTRRWQLRSSPKHLVPIVNYFEAKENRKMFRRLREREGREKDAKTEPEPEDEQPLAEEARSPTTSPEPSEAKEKAEKKPTATNAMTLRRAMTRYPDMANIFAFDDFAHRMMVLKPIPDPDRKSNAPFIPRAWEDTDETRLAIWFQSIGYLKASAALAFAVADLVAKDNRFHPVRDYLATLEWDGAPRCGELFRSGFGALAEDRVHEQYLLDIGRCWLISAVARVMDPGCKVDTMPILEGPQGAMKSSGVRALAPEPEWFSDTMPSDLDAKDARQHLPGKWLVEMSEISQLRKSEVESLKSFLSTQTDKYRPSYGRTEVSRHRQNVFVGTTNEDAYLSDMTGNRRFWPVKVGRVNLKWLRDNRDQLWAEALFLYRQNEKWWLDGEAAAYAEEQQKERLVDDEWDAVIATFVGHRSQVTVGEILTDAFHLDKAMHDKQQQMRVTTSLRKLGFSRNLVKESGKVFRRWERR